MKEEFIDIPEYEGLYQISNFGRIYSMPNQLHNGKFLSICKSNERYLGVGLSKKNEKRKTFQIHQLVAIAFLGHTPDGTHNIIVDHIDNNQLNNRLDNLQLITSRENSSKDKVGGSSKYIGVSWNKQKRKWCSQITINYRSVNLGNFEDEEIASKTYQKALKNIERFNGNQKQFRELLKFF